MSRVARGVRLRKIEAHCYPEQLHPDSPRGHAPPCYPDSLKEKHTTLVNITLRTIAYPIWICCSDENLLLHSENLPHPMFRRPSMVCPDALSGHLLPWIPKELSSISNCFGDQKAIKTPKLNTI